MPPQVPSVRASWPSAATKASPAGGTTREFVPPYRSRLPARPSRLTTSEESIKDKNSWLNNHFNSRRALDFSVASIC
uniref:Uncharacterized protein n=1 Tax=Oryza meridionalis TaxID=40149 RepID=A0A0E0C8R7_9ORYZ